MQGETNSRQDQDRFGDFIPKQRALPNALYLSGARGKPEYTFPDPAQVLSKRRTGRSYLRQPFVFRQP